MARLLDGDGAVLLDGDAAVLLDGDGATSGRVEKLRTSTRLIDALTNQPARRVA